MENINVKQPAEALNLTSILPNVTKYDRDLIKKIGLGVILIVVISIFFVMSTNNKVEVKEEEQLHFEHITPRLYDKNKVKGNNLHDNTAITTEHETNSQEHKGHYYRAQDSATKDPAKAGQHNVSLLREYFEQQALIKIKEEDDARISPMVFSMPTIDAGKTKVSANTNGVIGVSSDHAEINSFNNHGEHKLLKAGSIIPCVLSTAINSDLPGLVIARVREHVFDTVSGKFLLIPQGSMLIGRYNNEVNFGQERVQIAFDRLDLSPNSKYPSGFTVQLEQLTGSDLSGYSGMSDQVNNHYGKVAIGVSLSSLLAAAGTEKDELYEFKNSSIYRQRAINKASENISNIANKIADKQIKQNPTITIRSGVPFNIIVAKDLLLFPM